MNIKIEPEFENLNRPLSTEELRGLEDDIFKNGCLNPLIVWFDHNILLDGHNRKRICDKMGVEYNIETVELPDRHAAINWIIDHQLSRRNLNAEERRYLLGKKYLEEKKTKAEAGAMKGKSSGQNVHSSEPEKTAEKIAKEHNISEKTVRRAAKFAEEVDKLEPEEKRQVLSGEKKIKQKPKEVEKEEIEKKESKGLNLKSHGLGIKYAYNAIDWLKKIPLKDKLRKEGFEKVKQYIKDNI